MKMYKNLCINASVHQSAFFANVCVGYGNLNAGMKTILCHRILLQRNM